jgi:hypothetical protein
VSLAFARRPATQPITLAISTEGHFQIRPYGAGASKRDLNNRPRGHRWYDDYVRHFFICFLIHFACREFNVKPSRNRESRRAKRDPSGISMVVSALARNGIHKEEESVRVHLWQGLYGELARLVIAERPPEWFGAI